MGGLQFHDRVCSPILRFRPETRSPACPCGPLTVSALSCACSVPIVGGLAVAIIRLVGFTAGLVVLPTPIGRTVVVDRDQRRRSRLAPKPTTERRVTADESLASRRAAGSFRPSTDRTTSTESAARAWLLSGIRFSDRRTIYHWLSDPRTIQSADAIDQIRFRVMVGRQ